MKKYAPPRKEFLMLPNSVFDMPLDVYAFKIYAYLVCCAGSRGECWPTMNTISKKLGIAMSTVAVLSREPAIAEFYSEWNEVNREKLSLYYENKDPTIPLVDNKEFRSIKNMIIKAVLEMPPEIEQGASRNTMATAGGIIGSLARLIGGKCMAYRQRLQGQIDSKLQAKINEKKQALGLRTERTQEPSYQTQDEYDMSM